MGFKVFQDRENVEWTNTWIEACTNPTKPRILIIGDSVSRELRSEMSKMFSEYAFDFIGSSSSFEDPCFYNVLDAFFKNNVYNYQLILCNIVAKHGWYIQTNNNPKHVARYTKGFTGFVKYLQKRCKNVVLLTSTPNKLKEDPSLSDEVKNAEIQKRNAIQTKIFAKRGLLIVDLYSFVMQNQYAYSDHCHFLERSASQEIARYIMGKIQKIKRNAVTKWQLFGFISLLSIEEE